MSEQAASASELRIVLAGTDEGRDLTKLADYRAVGGYAQLERARRMEPDQVLDELLAADVRGRGGAGFPMGRKASFLPKPDRRTQPAYLVVNADESEPGTFKDRQIIEHVPHRLIEGCLITAWAIQANAIFIYIRGEYLEPFEILRRALDEAREEGLVSTPVVLHRGAGAYICGEETALLESLEGKRGQPRSKPPFPALSGLYASPSLINNVETIATVPKVIELGGAEYAKIGAPDHHSSGTRLFSLSGNVVNGGNFEVPLGTTLRELIYDFGGGIADGRSLKAIIPGGSSVPVLTAAQVDTPLDFDSIAAAGSMLGSGAVIVLDDRCCMVQLGLRVAQFYMHESCGKCTPCRVGTRWLVQLLHKIEDGHASQADLELLLDVCDRILGKCLCPLGDAAAMPVASYIDRYREEFQAHFDRGCPMKGSSPLDDVFAPVDQGHSGIPERSKEAASA